MYVHSMAMGGVGTACVSVARRSGRTRLGTQCGWVAPNLGCAPRDVDRV